MTYDSPGAGEANTLTLTGTYAGTYALIGRGVTSTVATPPGADDATRRANIIAGTGTGNLEEFAIDPFSFSIVDFTITGLTSASEAATYVHFFVEEGGDGTGFSEIRSVAVSNLDFTAPTVTWATDTLGETIIGTATEIIFGTESNANWSIPGHTVTATNISGDTITLTVSPTIAVDDVDTVSYTPGDVRDTRGTSLAAITSAAVTNNVTGTFAPSDLFTSGRDGFVILPSLTTSFESSDDSDAAEINDGVQFQKDSSGLGTPRNLSQATSSKRPTLQQESSTYLLDFEQDGFQELATSAYAHIGTGGVSVFARVKLETLPPGGTTRTVAGCDDGVNNANRTFRLRVLPDGTINMLGYDNATGLVSATSSATVSAGTWFNVCGVFNSTNSRVWINTMTDAGVSGTATNTAGTVKSSASAPVYVGSRFTGIADPFYLDGRAALVVVGNWAMNESDRSNLATFANGLI
jgi:hypothetical protein